MGCVYYSMYIYEVFESTCYQMNCPAGLERIRDDRPITIKDDKGNTSKCIADIVSVSKQIFSALRSTAPKSFYYVFHYA